MFAWLGGLPEWAQIVMGIGLLGVLVVLITIIARGGIRADIKAGKISLGAGTDIPVSNIEHLFEVIMDSAVEIFELSGNRKMAKQMKYADQKIAVMRTKKEANFYKLLKNHGVPHERLSSYEDCQLYTEIVGNMLYGENGVKSTKTIIRQTMRDGDFVKKEGKDFDTFIEDTMEEVRQNWNRYLNEHYESNVTNITGQSRLRIVSREILYDSEQLLVPDMLQIIRDIFMNGKRVHEEMMEEKERLIAKRKIEIKSIYEG